MKTSHMIVGVGLLGAAFAVYWFLIRKKPSFTGATAGSAAQATVAQAKRSTPTAPPKLKSVQGTGSKVISKGLSTACKSFGGGAGCGLAVPIATKGIVAVGKGAKTAVKKLKFW